jgi:hypothetical protein
MTYLSGSMGLSLAALTLQLLNPRQLGAGPRMFDELGHPLAQVEVLNGGDDRLTLGSGLGETHGICQVIIGNINSRFHASILT